MTVEEQLRDYKATLDAASEPGAEPALPRGVVPIRIRPARTLVVAAVAVAATIAVAFAAVGVAHRSSTSPAGVNTSTTPTSASSPITGGPARVANVVGLKSAEATTVLNQEGFEVFTHLTTACASPTGIVIAQQPPPGALAHAGTTATLTVCDDATSPTTTTLPVVLCPTVSGTVPSPSDPAAPKSLTISRPSFTAPELSGYSDRVGRLPITAPKGWNCKAGDGTDGSTAVGVTPPGVTPRDSWGVGDKVTQPPTDGVFGSSDGACQGCVYGDVCEIVPSAAADFPDFANLAGFCGTAPSGQQVTPLGNDLYRIDDPAGALGPDPAHSMLRYVPKTAATDATAVRVTCILPASQASVCDALLDEFVALNP